MSIHPRLITLTGVLVVALVSLTSLSLPAQAASRLFIAIGDGWANRRLLCGRQLHMPYGAQRGRGRA